MLDLFTDFVSIVVFDTISIAVDGCIQIPNDGDLVEIVDGVNCSRCIKKTCLRRIADNVLVRTIGGMLRTSTEASR